MQCANCGNCSILNKQQAKLAQNFLSEAESQFCDCNDYRKENFGNTKNNRERKSSGYSSDDELSSSPGSRHKGDLDYKQTIRDGIKESLEDTKNNIYFTEELPSIAEIKEYIPLLPTKKFDLSQDISKGKEKEYIKNVKKELNKNELNDEV